MRGLCPLQEGKEFDGRLGGDDGVETRAALVDTWKRSEGKEGKIKSEANYIHNGRKTGETSRM